MTVYACICRVVLLLKANILIMVYLGMIVIHQNTQLRFVHHINFVYMTISSSSLYLHCYHNRHIYIFHPTMVWCLVVFGVAQS